MFGSIGMPELIIILVIALIIFGPRKLPELGKSLGRSINEFKRASTDLQNTLEQEIKLEEQKEQQEQKQATDQSRFSPPPDHFSNPERRRSRLSHAAPTSASKPGPPLDSMALVPFPGATTPESERGDVGPYACQQRAAGRHARSSPFAGGGRRGTARRADDVSRASRRAAASASRTPSLRCSSASSPPSRSSTGSSAFVYARLTAEVPGRQFIYTEPGEAFFIWIKIAAIAGLLISSPYVMWQVWLFIAPGLYANEKKLAIPFVFFASTLFISGAAFSHYVLLPACLAVLRQLLERVRRVHAARRAGLRRSTSSCCWRWAWCSSCRC